MFNKHFMKTIVLFSLIILIGLIGVLVANSFEADEESTTTSRASVWCVFSPDC